MIGKGLIHKGWGGLQFTNDGTITTILGIAGDYIRIGDAGVTTHSLASEDDLLVTGKFEVDGDAYFDNPVYIYNSIRPQDDKAIILGDGLDALILYETADADAKVLLFMIDESVDSGNNVPAFVFGEQSLLNVNLGLFDAVVEPIVAVVDLDGDSAVTFGFSADDVGSISYKGSLTRIDFDKMGMLNYNAAAVKTIDGSGVVAVTQTYHSIVVTGGPGSGDDDLSSATGGSEGDILILKANASGSNNIVTVIDGTGSNTFILAGADFVLDHIDDRLMCIHNGTEWVEISRSSNS